jgi:hypothetical protein
MCWNSLYTWSISHLKDKFLDNCRSGGIGNHRVPQIGKDTAVLRWTGLPLTKSIHTPSRHGRVVTGRHPIPMGPRNHPPATSVSDSDGTLHPPGADRHWGLRPYSGPNQLSNPISTPRRSSGSAMGSRRTVPVHHLGPSRPGMTHGLPRAWPLHQGTDDTSHLGVRPRG